MQELTGYQLTEWMAFYALEPWGDLRDDFRSGQICATVSNYAGKSRIEGAAFAKASDFIPSYDNYDEPIEEDAPLLLDDTEEQSNLMLKMIFGKGD